MEELSERDKNGLRAMDIILSLGAGGKMFSVDEIMEKLALEGVFLERKDILCILNKMRKQDLARMDPYGPSRWLLLE